MDTSRRSRFTSLGPIAADVTAVAIAVVLGGTASEATHVDRTAYADVNDLLGVAS